MTRHSCVLLLLHIKKQRPKKNRHAVAHVFDCYDTLSNPTLRVHVRQPPGPVRWMVQSDGATTQSSQIGLIWLTHPEVRVAHEEARGGGITRRGHDQSLRRNAQQLALVEIVHLGAEVSLRESDVVSQARVLLLVAGIALVRLRCGVSCHVVGWS